MNFREILDETIVEADGFKAADKAMNALNDLKKSGFFRHSKDLSWNITAMILHLEDAIYADGDGEKNVSTPGVLAKMKFKTT